MTGWRTLDELADELRVSRRTVERWIARGEPGLDVLRLGGTVRARLVSPCVGPCRNASDPTPTGTRAR
jgi:excisionase family DNA binding protein